MPDEDKMLLVTSEVAEIVGISEQYLTDLIRSGDGPRFIRLTKGGRYRFRRSDVESWVNAKFRTKS